MTFCGFTVVINSSESGQKLFGTLWFYCVSGFATSLCGELWYHTRVDGFTCKFHIHITILRGKGNVYCGQHAN
jgi:hypothetical protein